MEGGRERENEGREGGRERTCEHLFDFSERGDIACDFVVLNDTAEVRYDWAPWVYKFS